MNSRQAPIDVKYAQTIAGGMTKPMPMVNAVRAAARPSIFSSRAIAVTIDATPRVMISRRVLSETHIAKPRISPATKGRSLYTSANSAIIQSAVQRLSVRYSSDLRKNGAKVQRRITDHAAIRADHHRLAIIHVVTMTM